jgi:luciferase family oxidoreductase group 1
MQVQFDMRNEVSNRHLVPPASISSTTGSMGATVRRGKIVRFGNVGYGVASLSSIPLSVLDLAPVVSGSTASAALGNSVQLAQLTERLGYRRYWVAEHHNMPGIASSAPAVLIAHLASVTEHIRVGSGGVMLPNHPPLVVAEQFGMLEALHPGRIDLGIGRAPGTDPVTATALRRGVDALSAEDFPEQLMDLLGFFSGTFPDEHPYRAITAVPGRGNMPAVWLLGSSGYSAQLAGLLGLPFAFAHHFSADNTLPALRLYREAFRPSTVLDQPYAMIGVSIICAGSDEEAERLARPGILSFVRLRSGRPGPLPTPQEAADHHFTPSERRIVESRRASQVLGGPDTVRRELADLLTETGADELMVTTMVYDQADRLRSYQRVAELAGLPERSAPARV